MGICIERGLQIFHGTGANKCQNAMWNGWTFKKFKKIYWESVVSLMLAGKEFQADADAMASDSLCFLTNIVMQNNIIFGHSSYAPRRQQTICGADIPHHHNV